MGNHVRKPDWLKVNISANQHFSETKIIVESHHLHTICSSGRCPNQGECWRRGTATFMIGGDVCTRKCKFCNTASGRPLPLNPNEPEEVAQSIQLMKLKHAVITSVDRDDLPDYGADHWVKTIKAIRKINPNVTMEVLIPDFKGNQSCIARIIEARPDVISHNMETVKRLTTEVRSVATYACSLSVLRQIAQSHIPAKTGIMVGLGETEDEVFELMDDVLQVGCQILTIGQYLQPTHKHYPVKEYVTPAQFEHFKEVGLQKGFKQVVSGPLVRSSYHAEEQVKLLHK